MAGCPQHTPSTFFFPRMGPVALLGEAAPCTQHHPAQPCGCFPSVCIPPAPLAGRVAKQDPLGCRSVRDRAGQSTAGTPRDLSGSREGRQRERQPLAQLPFAPAHLLLHFPSPCKTIPSSPSTLLCQNQPGSSEEGGQEVLQTCRGWFARRWHPQHSPRSSAATGSGLPSPSAGSGSQTGPRCCRSRTPAKADRESGETQWAPQLLQHPSSIPRRSWFPPCTDRKGHGKNEHVSVPYSIEPLQHPSPLEQIYSGCDGRKCGQQGTSALLHL